MYEMFHFENNNLTLLATKNDYNYFIKISGPTCRQQILPHPDREREIKQHL